MQQRLLILVLSLLGSMPLSHAQTSTANYPARQVEIIVPWPPGGGTDSVGRTLAVMARDRIPAIVDVPTMQEVGYDLHYSTWRGLAMAKGTPDPIVAFWQNVASKVVDAPLFTRNLAALSITPAYADARTFAADLATQRQQYEALLATVKIENR